MEEKSETQVIERTVKMAFENMQSISNDLLALNEILDRVAYREKEAAEKEGDRPRKEPQNLTETLELLQEVTHKNACAVEKLKLRAARLF